MAGAGIERKAREAARWWSISASSIRSRADFIIVRISAFRSSIVPAEVAISRASCSSRAVRGVSRRQSLTGRGLRDIISTALTQGNRSRPLWQSGPVLAGRPAVRLPQGNRSRPLWQQ